MQGFFSNQKHSEEIQGPSRYQKPREEIQGPSRKQKHREEIQGPSRKQKHRDEMKTFLVIRNAMKCNFFRLSESLRGNENPSFKPKVGH